MSYVAYIAATVILVVLSVYWILLIIAHPMKSFISNQTLQSYLRVVMTGLALLLACIPEGLPLAISLATALSTDRLIKKGLLLKNLRALETAGILTDVLVSKTSTLTEGKLSVDWLQISTEDK